MQIDTCTRTHIFFPSAPHLPKHVFDHFIEFPSDRRAFDGSKEAVKNEYKAHSACWAKFVKRNAVTFPSTEKQR